MGFLLQMAGFPGTGKSTVSNLISKHTGAIVLDRDVVKNAMLNCGIEGQVLADASYNVVFEMGSDYLSKGNSVIIDTPCYYKDTVDYGIKVARDNKADYKYIECIVNDYSIVENRLQTRTKLETQILSTTKERYYKVYDKSVKPEERDVLKIDTTSFDHFDINEILSYLSKRI